MPAVSLILDKFNLASPAEKLSLSIDSSISLRFPNDSLCCLDLTQLLELFCSGKAWVTRASGCGFEFTVRYEGEHCDELSTESISRDLGNYIRDAPFWSLLALDAKLNLPQSLGRPDSEPNFSISFGHSIYGNVLGHSGLPQLLSSADVRAPAGVLCFQLLKVKIVMNFKTSQMDPGKASNAFQLYSEPLPAAGIPACTEKERSPIGNPPTSKNCLLAQQAESSLFRARGSVSGIFSSHFMCQDDEMLNDCNLLYHVDGTRPSLMYQSMTQSSSFLLSPPDSQEVGMKDISTSIITKTVSLKLGCARRLTDLALRTLVGGRQIKSQPGIKIERPQPRHNLSQIAPSLFSPGYLEAISQRARFVPTISHALSTSLLRNVQSPSLRRKLLNLASKRDPWSDKEAVTNPREDTNGPLVPEDSETSPKLGQIIEQSLWAMMQRSLYVPLSARRLFPPKNDGAGGFEVAEDGLIDICTESDGVAKALENLPCQKGMFNAVSEGDFTDLFSDIYNEEPDSEFEDLCYDSRSAGAEDKFDDLFGDRELNGFDDIFQLTVRDQENNMDEIAQDRGFYWENMGETNPDELLDEVNLDEREPWCIENQDMLL